jgi:hypothetical protein
VGSGGGVVEAGIGSEEGFDAAKHCDCEVCAGEGLMGLGVGNFLVIFGYRPFINRWIWQTMGLSTIHIEVVRLYRFFNVLFFQL